MNEQKEIQETYFNFLGKRHCNQTVLNDTMEVLHLRKGAAYKRMNGDSALTTAELMRLSKHFNVSIDTALGNEDFVSFQHPFLDRKSDVDFLDRLGFYLKPIAKMENSNLIYLTNELPVFYYFSHKHIFTFLNAVWNHLHWQDDRLVIREVKQVDSRLEQLRTDVDKYYAGQEITEIWNSNMFANLYQQVIFSITIRAFEDVNFIAKLIKDIESLIAHLHSLASVGEKKGEGDSTKFNIYLNEFGNYLNMVIFQSEKLNVTFLGYDIPQFIVSHNQKFFEYSKDWVDRIRKRSVLISSGGYQYRELYFRKMENDFQAFKESAEKLVDVYYA